jgi:hypothetical protein
MRLTSLVNPRPDMTGFVSPQLFAAGLFVRPQGLLAHDW